MSDYFEKLKDPRWQKKRLEMFEKFNWTCQKCGSTGQTLNLHHKFYFSWLEPWGYEDCYFMVLCDSCHEEEHIYPWNIYHGLVMTAIESKLTPEQLKSTIIEPLEQVIRMGLGFTAEDVLSDIIEKIKPDF